MEPTKTKVTGEEATAGEINNHLCRHNLILKMLEEGASDKEIAECLCRPRKTAMDRYCRK